MTKTELLLAVSEVRQVLFKTALCSKKDRKLILRNIEDLEDTIRDLDFPK